MLVESNTAIKNTNVAEAAVGGSTLSTAPDMSQLNNKERAVFVDYLQNNHPGLLPHEHDDLSITKSDGQKLFDLMTYKGLAWVGTAGLSMAAAYTFKNGAGKPYFQKAVSALTPMYQHATGLSERVAHNAMTSGLMHIGLIVGGSTLLYPIKKLEDHKPQVVGYLDDRINRLREQFGNGPTQADLLVQEQTQERLKHAPRQTWGSVLTGRIAGVGTVFFTAIFIARGMDNVVAEKMSSAAVEALGQSSRPALQRISKSEKLKNIGTVAILDTGYSLLSEEVLYLTTRVYENIVGKKNTQLEETTTPKTEVSEIELLANKPIQRASNQNIARAKPFNKTFATHEPVALGMGA